MTVNEAIAEMKALATPEHFATLARFGINDGQAFGIKIPLLRQLARKIGKNHKLALELWATGYHEARILASFIDDYKQISEQQFDSWVHDFDSWDICDQCCILLMKTPFAKQKIELYASGEKEFVKRTAFVLMCALATHEKKLSDEAFYPYFELIECEACDERNFVRKAVNWALRQIGKRNEHLRLKAIECAERILLQNSKSARWIASDALRELKNEKIISRTVKK